MTTTPTPELKLVVKTPETEETLNGVDTYVNTLNKMRKSISFECLQNKK